jgi:catechol 2,3-dioxygenase-like lactoylglutathione lyase family enzyme
LLTPLIARLTFNVRQEEKNSAMNTPEIQDIGQIAITVSDVAVAKKFYTEVLGLRPLFDAGPNLSFVSAGSVRLMPTVPQGAGEVGKNSIIYFRTSGIADLYRVAIERGARAEREPQLTARLPDHELWIGFVRDPDGNLVGLMEERR